MTMAERFMIDHGVIHDLVRGKHVRSDPSDGYEDGINELLALLNGLSAQFQAATERAEKAEADAFQPAPFQVLGPVLGPRSNAVDPVKAAEIRARLLTYTKLPIELKEAKAKIATLEAELREAREEREGLRTAWHAEIRASAIIDKAAADAMVSTVREAHDLRARLAARDALLAECVAMLERRSVVIEAARVAVMAAMPAPADTGHDMPMIRDMAAKALYDALIAWDGNEADDLVRRAGGKT
jgi:hypothetical protein